MWEDEEKRSKRIKVVLIIISIILVGVLGAGMFLVRQNNSTIKEELVESSQQSETQNDENKAEVLNQIQADYDLDMQTVNTYVPGIVCWGDKLTGGSEGGVSYASSLQDLIDENICDLYDFRGTLDYADNVSRVTWTDYTVEIPVVNMGVGEESSSTILGRAGAVPYVVYEAMTVSADTEPVYVRLRSENGNRVEPLTAGDGGVNKVIIDGIEGTLSLKNGSYYFTRSEAGEEKRVEAGTEIITAASSMYLDYIPVIFIGSYGGYNSASELVEQIQSLIDHQSRNDGRYIVLGLYGTKISGEYWGSYYDYTTYEAALQTAFGEHFINLRKYLISDCANDLKITLTKDDNNQILNGTVPNSLRSSAGSIELSAAVYKQIGQVIYDKMDQLGYFDEVTEELGIDDVRAAIKQAELDAKLNKK